MEYLPKAAQVVLIRVRQHKHIERIVRARCTNFRSKIRRFVIILIMDTANSVVDVSHDCMTMSLEKN